MAEQELIKRMEERMEDQFQALEKKQEEKEKAADRRTEEVHRHHEKMVSQFQNMIDNNKPKGWTPTVFSEPTISYNTRMFFRDWESYAKNLQGSSEQSLMSNFRQYVVGRAKTIQSHTHSTSCT